MGKMKKMKNKKMAAFWTSIIIICLLIIFIPKYIKGNESANKDFKVSSDIEKIEIIHFHATNQCYSCKTVGAYAEETINTYYADELKSGKITFAHINAELPENYDLVKKYGVTGASLWIGVYTKDGKFSKEENVNVWYKISNKQDYMIYLKGVIEQKLAGK